MTARLLVSWATVSFCNLGNLQLEAPANFSLLGEIFQLEKAAQLPLVIPIAMHQGG